MHPCSKKSHRSPLSWHPKSQLVWCGGGLQCNGHRTAWAQVTVLFLFAATCSTHWILFVHQSRRSIHVLLSQVQSEDCRDACRPAGDFRDPMIHVCVPPSETSLVKKSVVLSPKLPSGRVHCRVGTWCLRCYVLVPCPFLMPIGVFPIDTAFRRSCRASSTSTAAPSCIGISSLTTS